MMIDDFQRAYSLAEVRLKLFSDEFGSLFSFVLNWYNEKDGLHSKNTDTADRLLSLSRRLFTRYKAVRRSGQKTVTLRFSYADAFCLWNEAQKAKSSPAFQAAVDKLDLCIKSNPLYIAHQHEKLPFV